MFKHYLALILLAITVMGSPGCNEQHPIEHPDAHQWLTDKAATNRAANISVLEVNGRAIDAVEFRAFWERHPSLERSDVVEALVGREILFHAALSEKMPDTNTVAFMRKQAMVLQMLHDQVENTIKPDDIDDEILALRTEDLRQQNLIPEGLQVSHIVVLVPGHSGDSSWQASYPDLTRENLYDLAYHDATTLYDEVVASPSLETMTSAVEQMRSTDDMQLEVAINEHLRFARDNTNRRLPRGWIPVVESFRKASVELFESEGLGAVSKPVRTEFGWHIILAESILKAEQPSQELMRRMALEQLMRERRSEKLHSRLSEWINNGNVDIYPELVGAKDIVAED